MHWILPVLIYCGVIILACVASYARGRFDESVETQETINRLRYYNDQLKTDVNFWRKKCY